jgi:hypothetical protein
LHIEYNKSSSWLWWKDTPCDPVKRKNGGVVIKRESEKSGKYLHYRPTLFIVQCRTMKRNTDEKK